MSDIYWEILFSPEHFMFPGKTETALVLNMTLEMQWCWRATYIIQYWISNREISLIRKKRFWSCIPTLQFVFAHDMQMYESLSVIRTGCDFTNKNISSNLGGCFLKTQGLQWLWMWL